MLHKHLLLMLLLAAAPASAETVAANQAKSHVGQSVTVEGVATSVYTSSDGTTFVDVDGRYPNQVFTAVIVKSVPNSGDLSSLQGKTVDILGTVKIYSGKPEIVVTARSQIAFPGTTFCPSAGLSAGAQRGVPLPMSNARSPRISVGGGSGGCLEDDGRPHPHGTGFTPKDLPPTAKPAPDN